MSNIRHFTATGFVVDSNAVLLHWHPKVSAWLPPGGHIEVNEDPVEAVLREIFEETGLKVEILSTREKLDFNDPVQIEPPFTIMVEKISDKIMGDHNHIDMIYFCKLIERQNTLKPGWIWVDKVDILKEMPLMTPSGSLELIPKDVSFLAIKSFEYARKK
ncbi:MAG: DNA mismatch repair protein MutT [Chloroflexi bacterium]|nr:DNA mismatch repair protein MutT [Chloroflexota bacterium]|tara:strand:+ start:12355 stop:12834 length:480 start_codon:yes stop_codon:yes gene_type:complete